MAKKQQRQGKQGEQAGERELRRLGVKNLAEIQTPMIVVRGQVRYKKKVFGDRRGELENGISVLAEIKTTIGKGRFTWSSFNGEHQPMALSNHKGLSVLVWVCETDWTRDIYVLEWRTLLRFGFKKGRGIGKEEAAEIAMVEDDFDQLAAQKVRVVPV